MTISIKEELKKLRIYTISNEKLYKVSEFEEILQSVSFDIFESDDIILTPYLQEYISYLQSSKQLKAEIQKVFSAFDKGNLYFEVY